MNSRPLTIRLRLFASAKDLAGFPERSVDLQDGASGADVLAYLETLSPQFRDWRPFLRLAVNREFVPESQRLQAGDEVAVIPPVSGG
jgi:molybdopterin converting factor subunit 1